MLEKQLDYDLKKAGFFQISNDAFYNLKYGEPCFDEENLDEIEELKAMFPYGFKISDKIEFVENTDLIECEIIPICVTSSLFTHYIIEGKWFKSEYYYSADRKQAYYRTYNMYDKRFIDYGWNDVRINQFGKPVITPKNNCIFPLWGNNWHTY